MSNHSAHRTFATRHTTREFHSRLFDVWGFEDGGLSKSGGQVVARFSNGGFVFISRSARGVADPGQVKKATKILGITEEEFWTKGDESAPSPRVADAPRPQRAPRSDTHIATVLSVHVAQDKPMSLDDVVAFAFAGGKTLNRGQVASASAKLCNDGDLKRVRSGMYQWASGTLAGKAKPDHVVSVQITQDSAPASSPVAVTATAGIKALDMFELLFPDGVKMTAEVLSDLDEWKRLTEKFLRLAN